MNTNYLQTMAELYSGQCWEQTKFPFNRIAILYLGRVDKVPMFCRLVDRNCLNIWHDKDSRWMYSFDEMLELLHGLKYTPTTNRGILEIKEV